MLRDSGCMLRVVIVVLSLVLRVTGCGLLGTVVFVLSSLTSHRFVTGCMLSSLSGCICCLISCVTGCGFRVTSCGLQVIVVVRLYLLSSLSYFLLLIAHRSPLTSHLFCCGLRVSSYRLPLLSCCLTFYLSLLISHLSSLTSHLFCCGLEIFPTFIIQNSSFKIILLHVFLRDTTSGPADYFPQTKNLSGALLFDITRRFRA